jgi:hypothetical protein
MRHRLRAVATEGLFWRWNIVDGVVGGGMNEDTTWKTNLEVSPQFPHNQLSYTRVLFEKVIVYYSAYLDTYKEIGK